MTASFRHISQPPSGSPAPLVGLFARAQRYTHKGLSGTVILADLLPALDYRWDLSLHLWIIRLAQHGTERAGAHLSTESPPGFSTPLLRTALEKIVCCPHCFVQIHPALASWCSLSVCRETLLFWAEFQVKITTWDKSSIMHLWKWAQVGYKKDSRF